MGLFERLLSLWLGLALVAGVALGFARINLPIALIAIPLVLQTSFIVWITAHWMRLWRHDRRHQCL